jgi:condensin complex subunit 3
VRYSRVTKVESAEEERQGEDDEDDTMETRFVGRLLDVLFKGFVAKDKSVRYRSVFVVAEMVSHLGELEYAHPSCLSPLRFWRPDSEDLYQKLRSSLLDRVYDKETPVRVQAVIALSKLCGSETEEDTEEGEQTATEVLLDIMAQDPAA